ncbi:MAG: GAF domain-containing protein, partial [Elusimicrobiales bacterium]
MRGDNQNLEMLITVARLLSSKLDISDLLHTIMRVATRVVNSERASLYLLDEKNKELYFHVALDLEEDVKKIRLKLGEGIAGICALEGRSIISNSPEADSRHSKKVDEKSGYITRSLLTCPMIIKGRVIGVVQAINKIDGEFDEIDRNNFEAFASQAAIAIENSRLFNSVRYEKSKLETIFEMINESVIVSDSSGRIKMANKASLNYFGITDFNALNIRDFLRGFKSETEFEDLFIEKKQKEFLLERTHPKRLILRCNFIPKVFKNYDMEEEEEFIWIFNDVTKEVIETRISREFLSLISHKLKTPLTSIVGFSQILKRAETGDEKTKRAVEAIFSCGIELNGMVERMLFYSDIENKNTSELNFSLIDSTAIIEEIISEFKDIYRDVEFEKDIIEGFSFKADANMMRILFKEIISNSVKFNSKQNKKIIITSKVDKDKGLILIWDNG